MEDLCKSLLKTWCDRLLSLQINGTNDPRLDGAILCPACGRIHGRCFEAMYPFLCMAGLEKDEKWVRAAEGLFIWAENTVSLPDGSYVNDIESGWLGTTVFETIQLADCLLHHGDLLSGETADLWKKRIARAAGFLCEFESLNNNNINYPISNALAMYECGLVLGEEKYLKRAAELARLAEPVFTEMGLLFGEGVPRFKKSGRGCRPVDIGYNVEETLPSLAMYGCLSGDEKALSLAENGLSAHLNFMLENGAWDNSFGTRNFKWTYWGSRTSDGCALGYLLMADRFPGKHPEFVVAAKKNLKLLKQCTSGGLLMGGPHYEQAGQPACVHHTFTHAKVLAGILDRGLWPEGDEGGGKKVKIETVLPATRCNSLPRQQKEGIVYYPEIATWLVNLRSMTATVTAYDWEYLPGGHASGGTISLLHHNLAGTLLCSGVNRYTLKEPNNMQTPYNVRHECLALRVEAWIDGEMYSSTYDDTAIVEAAEMKAGKPEGLETGPWENGAGKPEKASGTPANLVTISAKGVLKNDMHQEAPGRELAYQFVYRFEENSIEVEAHFEEGTLVCPIISGSDEDVACIDEENMVEIHRENTAVRVETSHLAELPYGQERIFNLVPGLQALRLDLKPVDGFAGIVLSVHTQKFYDMWRLYHE